MRTSILVYALADRYGSVSAASREADIPLATLFKLKRGNVDLRMSTLVGVAHALGVKTSDVVRMIEPG